MKRKSKMLLSSLLVLVLTVALSSPAAPSVAAKKKVPVLSTKSITMNIKAKKTIKVKNASKTVKWSIKKGAKFITLSKKKKSSVTVTGKKAGSAVVNAKIGKKTLSCKVTVKKKATKKTATTSPVETPKASATVAPTTVPSSAPSASPSTVPSASPTTLPSAIPSALPSTIPSATPTNAPYVPVAVQDLVINLTGLTTTFTETGAKIDFSSQIDDKFDLSYYKSVVINYKCTFEGDDTSTWNCGKIGLPKTADTLNGFDDGVKHNDYSMTATGDTTTINLAGESLTGKVVGINIQPMDSDYAWPSTLTSIEITGIKFVAKEGATYPDPSVPATPTPTPLPTYAPESFSYEGLDTSWIDPAKPMVAFTFDDGPCGISENSLTSDQLNDSNFSTSDRIENILHNNGAHATFFCIGSHITEEREAEIKRMKEWGFEIGNHSWGWSALSSYTAEEIMKSVGDTNTVLKRLTGYNNFLFRAPNLSVSAAMKGYIKAPFIGCAIDSKDWNKATRDEIIANVQKAQDGDVVLMHATQENTAQAVQELLTYFHDKGWQVVSVSEMFAVRLQTLMTGTSYTNVPSK